MGKQNARRVALMGMLFALAMVLSFVEGLLPVLPALPPGVKLGLSNMVTMYALFFLGWREAFLLAVLKALFVLLSRGGTAALLSLSGGLLSVAVMALLTLLPGGVSRHLLSICGAVAHNIGQLLASALVLSNTFALGYLPLMVLSGLGMGLLTSLLLKMLLPYLAQLDHMVRKRTQ